MLEGHFEHFATFSDFFSEDFRIFLETYKDFRKFLKFWKLVRIFVFALSGAFS